MLFLRDLINKCSSKLGRDCYTVPLYDLIKEAYVLGLKHGNIWSNLSEQKQNELSSWKKKQDKKVADTQGKDKPYYGAIGGAYTYSHTFTSLGVVLTVKNGYTDDELDLSDYEEW
jgi:hypothetical protein